MFIYILKRIIIFIPTLFIISLITFWISKMAPGDPIEVMLAGQGGEGQRAEKLATERSYQDLSERFGYHLPNFYFALTSASYPDTLYRIQRKRERETLERFINQYGNWPAISEYYQSLKTLEYRLFDLPQSAENFSEIRLIRESVNELYREYRAQRIENVLEQIKLTVAQNPTMAGIQPDVNKVEANYHTMVNEATPLKKYTPSLHFFGINNQYHRWLFGDEPWIGKGDESLYTTKGFFRGDFGISFQDRRPVSSVMMDAIKWTVILNFISIFLSYLISIPVGVVTAVRKDTLFDNVSTAVLFILYSLPSFWIATLLIIFFTTPEYGMNFFPTHGLGKLPDDAPFFERFRETSYHLILPIFCLTYGSFAFISRQMRGGMLSVIRQDYIRTARAKGLNEDKVIWKHAFRNSLIPIITMFASLFPLAISGSVVIESIFSIPGMGQISYLAVLSRNYPIVFTVLMFSAILTMVGNLVADMMYAMVDPRISFTKK